MKQLLIDKELCNALQARSIELTGLERLITFTMSGSAGYEIPQEKIDELIKKHAETTGEYEILKEKVSSIVTAQFGPNVSWNLNFEDQIAYITE